MKMKKFINDPENLTPELLEGFAAAHSDLVTLGDQRMVINNKLADADRVTIVTQGGSGHEPAISGFVGVLSGVLRSFVYAVEAVRKQKAGE